MQRKAAVTVRRLNAPHQEESFSKFLPLNDALKQEVFAAVKEVFDAAGGKSLLKSSGDVYIKPNGVDAKPYGFTRAELVEAVIQYWKDAGARTVYLFENPTQCTFARMVFELTGYGEICRRLGAKPVYLDEEEFVTYRFHGKRPEAEEELGYRSPEFHITRFVKERLIDHADENLYISIPKMKTHSMAGVTLGVKNQWAFVMPADRREDHNYNLPYKLSDVLSFVRPDFTLIEGIEATVYGHYPLLAFADKSIQPFRVLIGSKNVVAADLVGVRLFGMELEDVPYLKLAIERGYAEGVRGLEDIEVIGDISDSTEKFEYKLYPQFPADVPILKGKERLCAEGCLDNPLTLLQALTYDYGGRGGWTMVMGKGHDRAEIDAITGKVLIIGQCAFKELGDDLIRRLGKKNVYYSGHCNDLCATLNALCHLMKVNPSVFAHKSLLKSAQLLLQARFHGTKAIVPHPLAAMIKVV